MLEAYVDPAAPVLAGYRALTVKKAVLQVLKPLSYSNTTSMQQFILALC
jgi:hypothetical protein